MALMARRIRGRRAQQQFELDGVPYEENDPSLVFRGLQPRLPNGRAVSFDVLRRELGNGLDPFALPGMMGYGMRELTAAINRIETVPLMLEGILGESYSSVVNRLVTVEEQSDILTPAPSVPVKGNAPVEEYPDRKLIPFEIPRFAIQKDVSPEDVEQIRAFATLGDQQSVEEKLMEVIGKMLNRIKVAEELMRRGSVDGKQRVVKPDGSVSDIFDYYDVRGTAPIAGELKLGPNDQVNPQFLAFKRKAERKVQGQGITKWAALASSDVYDAITTHQSVKEAFLNWQNAMHLLDDNRAAGFRFAANIELFDVGSQVLPNVKGGADYKWWGDGTLKIVPVGTTQSRNAPILHKDAIGKPGLPAYVSTETKKHGAGYEVQVSAHYVAWNTQLEAITNVTIR